MTEILIQSFIPLAFLIVLGFVVGKAQNVDLKSVAVLAIYGITPIVAFGSAARLEFTPTLILLPIITFVMAAMVGFASLYLGRIIKNESYRFLLPVACGSGNTGYFGLPVAIALFGVDVAGIYFLATLGVVVFETTIGYYYMARGSVSPRESIMRVAKLPVLYALAFGLIFSAANIDLPETATKLWELSKNTYIVIGMMIAGIGLSTSKSFSLKAPLLGVALTGKFILWPLLAIAFKALDTGLLSVEMHNLILVMSVTPIAANLTAYAAANDGPVSEAAMLVLITTVIAILGLPFLLPLLISV